MSRGAGLVVAAAIGAAVAFYLNPSLIDDLPVLGEFVAAATKTPPDRGGGAPRARRRKDGGPGDRIGGIPARYRALYQKAAANSCVGWRLLAAIGQVESRHGANVGPSSAGALGPMQFMPATWRSYGRDGNGDGRADVHDPADAIPSAAAYLCAHGYPANRRRAIWHYNHSWRYVDLVQATQRRIR